MDVSELLAKDPNPFGVSQGAETSKQPHPYPTRQASSSLAQTQSTSLQPNGPLMASSSGATQSFDRSAVYTPRTTPPSSKAPRTINFQLMLSNDSFQRARLPLRVHINDHDTTESIITTVKNFYGLYEGQGVSFEDCNGHTLIAQYENLKHNDTVFVRVFSEKSESIDPSTNTTHGSGSPQKFRLDEPFQMLPPQPYSRPSSRTMKMRDVSPPLNKGDRSGSARSQNRWKLKASLEGEDDAANGMSDSDAGSVSVSSSRRDQLASAEISLDNIVEGGRRKKAKFESSELPLFVPSQQPMTASMSSISPQRRLNNNLMRSPVPLTNQYTFSLNQPLPSPQSFGHGDNPPPSFATPSLTPSGIQNPTHGHRLRTRGAVGLQTSRLSRGSMSGILPTPDPTIGSVISDEDVAMQLMRLGDASNLSHGRTSTSTVDDALSGKAEVASSVEVSEDESEDGHEYSHLHARHGHTAGPARKRARGSAGDLQSFDHAESSEEEYEDYNDTNFNGNSDEIGPDAFNPGLNQQKSKNSKLTKSRTGSGSVKGQGKPRVSSVNKSKLKSSAPKIPPSPYSLPSASRKTSNASSSNFQQFAADEEDLSSKPRCQRCRKSKKGCDRQRPCGRCRDAGIGIEGCVSEDEGNGRKGRYGRHMGVPVKKPSNDSLPTATPTPIADSLPSASVAPWLSMDNNKKRKR